MLRGRLAAVEFTSASADLLVASGTGLRARTASGDVQAASVDGDLAGHSASGNLHTGRATGAVTVTTASGDLRLGTVCGDVDVTTASADIAIECASSGAVDLRTVSGDATVGVARGLRLWLDLQSASGTLDSRLDRAPDDDGDTDPATLSVQMTQRADDSACRCPRSPATCDYIEQADQPTARARSTARSPRCATSTRSS